VYEEAIGYDDGCRRASATMMDAEGLNEGIGCMPMIGFVPMDGICG